MTQYFEDQRIAALKPEALKDHFTFKGPDDIVDSQQPREPVHPSSVVNRIVKENAPLPVPPSNPGNGPSGASSGSSSSSSIYPVYHVSQIHQNNYVNVNGFNGSSSSAQHQLMNKPISNGSNPDMIIGTPQLVAVPGSELTNHNNALLLQQQSRDSSAEFNHTDIDINNRSSDVKLTELEIMNDPNYGSSKIDISDINVKEARIVPCLIVFFYVLGVRLPLSVVVFAWVLVSFLVSVGCSLIPGVGRRVTIATMKSWRKLVWLDLRIYR
ncbi:hypothetical protein HDU76_009959 [Blyttiomyces sp. JEL0837]|nr:hypothetical protein HDU76_009959 [Blyttiomyces sp. JEL0837]